MTHHSRCVNRIISHSQACATRNRVSSTPIRAGIPNRVVILIGTQKKLSLLFSNVPGAQKTLQEPIVVRQLEECAMYAEHGTTIPVQYFVEENLQSLLLA